MEEGRRESINIKVCDMKRILGIILFLFSFCLSSLGVEITEVTDLSKIHKKAAEAKQFVAQKGMNQDWCILIDFSYNLFTKRMFIYDLKNGKIIETALVSHGVGGGSDADNVVFSNVEGSGCSSEGKYRLGIRSYSKFGVHYHYKMHGLESTNSNAYKRYIVLHSYEYAYCDNPTTASLGCPVICDDMMIYLDKKIKASSNKSLLLWIFK